MVMNGESAGCCRRRIATLASLVMVGLGAIACGAGGNSSSGVTPVASVAPAQSLTPMPRAEAPKFLKVSARPVPGTKQDALFLEAKKVYETYLEQIYKLEVGDGVNSVSAEL